MVTNLTQLGYVNNYDKNRYLENFSKAAVENNTLFSRYEKYVTEAWLNSLKQQVHQDELLKHTSIYTKHE